MMKTQTKQIQDSLTSSDALRMLIEGNDRFIQNIKAQRNLKEQVVETSKGQFPFAVVLGCIDSRVPTELVFDQGIGDIFSARVAGNIVNEDILASIEYSCKVAGSKIVVVMGHTKCGAVTAACNNVELGNITALMNKIKPAVDIIKVEREILDDEGIEKVSEMNVRLSINQIRKESPILSEMEMNNEIKIIGAMYDVSSGKIEFYKE